MISSRQIKGLILASLMLSTPTYPAGWLDTPWKKVGIGVAAFAAYLAIVGGITYAILRYKYNARLFSKVTLDRPADLPIDSTPEQQVMSTVKILLDRGIDHKTNPDRYTQYKIKGCRFGFQLLPTQANNLLDRGRISEDRTIGTALTNSRSMPELIELVEEHTRKKNQAAIAERIQQINFSQDVPEGYDRPDITDPDISDLIASYATEKERDVRDITVASQQQNPLALEEVV